VGITGLAKFHALESLNQKIPYPSPKEWEIINH
jgi:hypothetical protein